ncbi:dual specificity tyrosine-phosphorylation-regulated kinase 4-like isoform X2 [Genypterus blacodes]
MRQDTVRNKGSQPMQEIMEDAMKVLKKRQQAVISPGRKTVPEASATEKLPKCPQKVGLPSIPKILKKTPQPATSPEKAPKVAGIVSLPPLQKMVRKTTEPEPDDEKIPKCCFSQQPDGTQVSQQPNTKNKQKGIKFKRIPQDHILFLQQWGQYLTDFEKEEITQYTEVWFFGNKTCKKIHGSTDVSFNNGYDSNLGYFNIVLRDHLAYRYEVLKELGRHTGGTVLKCRDHKTKEKVAIKVIRNVKRSIEEAQCELEMLELLQRIDPSDQANIVHMKDSFMFRNHICIIFELFEKNFEMVIGCRPSCKLSMEETRHYAIDLLKCLLLLRGAGIVHGDLKPGNMLLSRKSHTKHAKVIDFGGSYMVSPNCSPKVVTYAYAAPEVLLDEPCDASTDMWSLGCILIEMFTGGLIFGENDNNTFKEIMKVLHFSVKDLIQLYPRQERYFGYRCEEPEVEPESQSWNPADFLETKDV